MVLVKFTGNRTGKESLWIERHGVLHAGDVVEVDDATAERWTTAHATADGGEASDFELVDLEELSKPELSEILTEDMGLPLPKRATKADLIETIEKEGDEPGGTNLG